MQSKIIERILNEDNKSLQEIIEIVRNNTVFQDVMSNIKEEFFINDSIHGISHNERVTLLACYIGIQEGLNNEELRLVLESAKYHDIGRGFEGNHGQYSAIIIDRNKEHIFPNLSDDEINTIKALCHGHSVDDKKYEEVARLYGIKNIEKFKRLLDVVKDADALDRVRLPRFGGLDERYLRTETSKRIIDFSKELFREYRSIQQNIIKEESENIETTSNYKFDKDLRNQLLFDGENYYLIRSLNKSDIENFDSGNGILPKIDNKYGYTVQDIMAQIRMQHRKTNLISMSEDPNIVLTYDKSNLHRFVLIKLSKDEIEDSKKVFSAGEYLLGVMDYCIEMTSQNAPENVRKILEKVDNASSIQEIIKIINGADRQVPTNLVESKQQYLSEEEQLEQSKKIAKCKVLNYYGLMRGITRDEKGKLIDISGFMQIMRNGYSSSEWLYSGKIEQEKLIDIPQILVDSLALVKQAEFQGKDKEILKEIEQEILKLAVSGTEINQDNYQLEYSLHKNLRNDLTIAKAYKITNGQISYRDTNMQMTAIRSLAEMTLNKRKIIELLQDRMSDIDVGEFLSDTYCVNQEMVTRKNNRGSQIGRNISFIISDYGYDFDDETSEQILQNIEKLTNEQLIDIISQGVNAQEINNLIIKTREKDERIQAHKSKRLGSKYIAEAIVEGYNWKQDGNTLTESEKALMMNTLLKSVGTNNELYKLYEAINKIQLGRNKFTQNEIFAIMINLAIDGKIGDILYKDLTKKNRNEIQRILLDNKESLQTSVLPISIDLLAGKGREISKLKKELIDLGIDKDFIESKDIRNLYIAKQIIDKYDFNIDAGLEEKRAIIYALLKPKDLGKTKTTYLSKSIEVLKKMNISEQEIYGALINLAICGSEKGYGFTNIIRSGTQLKKWWKESGNKDLSKISNIVLLKAKSDSLNDQERKKIKERLLNIGVSPEIIETRDESNLYVAEQIVQNYNFKDVSKINKALLIQAILSNENLNQKRSYSLSNLLLNLESINLNEQEIYATIINLAINNHIIENKEGYSYTRLLDTSTKIKELKKFRSRLQVEVKERDIEKLSLGNIVQEDIVKYYEELEIPFEFIDAKATNNLYIAKQIVEGYFFEKELTKGQKRGLLKSILDNTFLNKTETENLYDLIQNFKEIGLTEQETYGTIINLGVKGFVIPYIGYGYTRLLCSNNLIKKMAGYKDLIDDRVDSFTINLALEKNLTENEIKELKSQYEELKIPQEIVETKNVRNLYMAKQIVDRFDFGENKINQEDRRVLIQAILKDSSLNESNNPSYLSNLVMQLNQIGLNEQEIYGTIINSSINESAINKSGYSYSRLLHSNNIVLELSQYKEQIETNVSKATIKKAKLLAINQEQIIEEYINIGFQEDFIEKKDVRNLYTAKQILDRYNFDRELSQEEKRAILYAILNNSTINDTNKRRVLLISLVNGLDKIGYTEEETYGIIINLAINGKIIPEGGYSYSHLLMKREKVENLINYKSKINTNVTEETIQKAVQKANKPKKVKGQDIAKSTMELTIAGSGGSQVCDDVQTDYQRLMIERTNENKKEGSEQDVPN